MAAFMRIISSIAQRWETSHDSLRLIINAWNIFRNGPPPSLAVAGCPSVFGDKFSQQSASGLPTLDSIFDGILCAVPKHRRSIEQRLTRKHRFTGLMEHGMPKTNLIPCLECGHFKEKGHLCKNCYEKVRQETKEMQAKMGDDLEFDVPRKETEFVYEGEKTASEGTFVVRMNKQRPSWFPKRLLNKTGS